MMVYDTADVRDSVVMHPLSHSPPYIIVSFAIFPFLNTKN